MFLLLPILLNLVLSEATNEFIFNRTPTHVPNKRSSSGYVSNVVHSNPLYPDQSIAQSSVDVNFNSQSSGYSSNNQPYINLKQVQSTFLKSQSSREPTYSHQHLNDDSQFQYSQVSPLPRNDPQTQLFNVGYSVSFKNQQPKPIVRAQNFEHGEIITGTRKHNEEIQYPTSSLTPQEYVSNALTDIGKYRFDAQIKDKNSISDFTHSIPGSNNLITQNKVSPPSENFFKTLKEVKLAQQQQQTKDRDMSQQNGAWTSLSPNVEIIKSAEIPSNHKAHALDKYQFPNFDHANALGRSQGFDFSNAMNSNKETNHQNQQSHTYSDPRLEYNHDALRNTQQSPIVLSLADQLQTVNSKLSNRPIDMRLVRNPILTTNVKNINHEDSNSIPIHLDTRLLQQALNNQLSQQHNQVSNEIPYQQPQSSYLQNPVESEIFHHSASNQQTSQAIVGNTQNFNEVHNKNTMNNLDQNYQIPYRIYGKPQPNTVKIKDQHYDIAGDIFKKYGPGELYQRQPRLKTNLQRSLRPPRKSNTKYQRRIYI